jgi:signal transduction histidine kinase
MRTFDLKTNPEPIPYPKNDEIGDLIVEFNKMINQVEESAQKLAHSERDTAWREMARQIAHEIKNPLTPMKLSLQYLLMLKKANDARWLDQFDRFATSQVEQIDSLAKIANEFSNFAKISFDESIPPINLASVVEETIPIFDGYPNLNLEVNLNSSLAFVVADREHIKRVLVNLVKNATQAAENDSEVTVKISLQVSTNTALITVTDNGKGIKEEEKAKIFTPNFTTKTSGSGLGLAISKNLIEMYGGRIWFESVKNNGTSFYIEIPIFISK